MAAEFVGVVPKKRHDVAPSAIARLAWSVGQAGVVMAALHVVQGRIGSRAALARDPLTAFAGREGSKGRETLVALPFYLLNVSEGGWDVGGYAVKSSSLRALLRSRSARAQRYALK